MIESAAVSVGLVSDTHFQDRLFDVPDNLAAILDGAELILHSGDVGELQILDWLGLIAPVVAVHGNDEPDYVKRELPSHQVVSLSGTRVLLWHSHYPDRAEELANRAGPWGPKLQRITQRGRDAGARIVVFGHTHVPMAYEMGGVWLMNPGALAAGNYFTRQITLTAARLRLARDGSIEVRHYDVRTGRQTEPPVFDLDDEFDVAAGRCQEWMVEPDLVADVARLRQMAYQDVRSVVQAIVPLHRRRLPGGSITRAELLEAIRSSSQITATDQAGLVAVLEPGREPPRRPRG